MEPAKATAALPTSLEVISAFMRLRVLFVFFDGETVAFGGALEGFGGPEFSVEDGVGVDDVAADA